jgi:hypothetical protein
MEIDGVQPRYPVRECAFPKCGKKFLPVSAIQNHCSKQCTQRDCLRRFRAKQRANRPQPPNKPPTKAKARKIDAPGQVVMFQSPGEGQSGKERAAA